MPYESYISLRYLRAKRKQVFVSVITLISITGIFLGVAALIVVLAVMNGFETDLRNKILGINSHAVVMQYTGPMQNYRTVQEAVNSTPGVVASTPFIYSQGMLKNGDGFSGVVIRGLSPEDAFRVISLGKMKEGSAEALLPDRRTTAAIPKDRADLPGILVGKELAKQLGLYLYETVSLISPMGTSTPMGMVPRMKRFLVVGIFESGFYEYDSSLAYLSLRDCQAFLGMDDRVTGIEIKVNDLYRAADIAKNIEKKLGFPYWARNWMEMNKNLFAALRLEKKVMFIILSLIVLVATFNIITTLIMVVMEKSKDIAILKSMGATSRSIMKIFILQGVTIGFIGTVLGCAGGLLLAWNIEPVSSFIERFFGFKILPGDVYYLSELPSRVNYTDVGIIVVGTLLISFLSTLYPSWRASRMDPAEALRYD